MGKINRKHILEKMSQTHIYKDRQTGVVMAKADHELPEVLPGLVEVPKESVEEMEEVNMSKDDEKEYLDLYANELRKSIPKESKERERFESSIEGVKDYILHENLKFYCNKTALHSEGQGRKSITLAYGHGNPDLNDSLLMIRGGLMEDHA